MNNYERIELLLSARRALIGTIGESVVGVAISKTGRDIQLDVFHVGEISEDEWDDMQCAATEIVSDFGDAMIDVTFTQISDNQFHSEGLWLYVRRGFRYHGGSV